VDYIHLTPTVAYCCYYMAYGGASCQQFGKASLWADHVTSTCLSVTACGAEALTLTLTNTSEY